MRETLIKFYTACYDGCYAIGVLFLRAFFRVSHSFLTVSKKIIDFIANTAIHTIWSIYQGIKFLFSEFVLSTKAAINFFKHFKKMRKHSFEVGGKELVRENTKHLLKNSRRQIIKHLCTFASYVLPLLALVIFITCVGILSSRTYAVAVSINGNHIGYIEDENVYNTAEKLMQERIVYGEGEQPYAVLKDLTVATVDKDVTFIDSDTLCNNLVAAVTDDIKEAFGLYVDGKFEGAVEEKDKLQMALDDLLREGETDLGDKLSEDTIKVETEFAEEIEIIEGLYPSNSVMTFVDMHTKLHKDVAGERTYTAVAGDSVWGMAEKNSIPRSKFRSLNPQLDDPGFVIWPGDVFLISQSVPFLTVQTKVTEKYEVTLPYAIKSINSSKYPIGTTTVLSAGKSGKGIKTDEKIYIDGILQSTETVNTDIIEAPVDRELVFGSYIDSTNVVSANENFIWPVAGGYVSCHINGYPGHTGMDIAAPYGTYIWASKSGVVTRVRKQTTGYGYHIMIDHGNGVQTLYAHCSRLNVSVGQAVKQGQIIGYVGSTGNSTGNHCHFEIRMNGQYKNPAYYIGK